MSILPFLEFKKRNFGYKMLPVLAKFWKQGAAW